MGYTEPRSVLARSKPADRVLSMPLMTSTVMQIAVVVFIQVIGCTSWGQLNTIYCNNSTSWDAKLVVTAAAYNDCYCCGGRPNK